MARKKESPDLFGKTFDQQVAATDGDIAGRDLSPNSVIEGTVVFEPLLQGVRVTARDKKHAVLWGFIASKGMLEQIHCPVAVYSTLWSLIAAELKNRGLPSPEGKEPLESAIKALDDAEKLIANLRKSLAVKKVSDATRERAKVIANLASDAARMIELGTSSMKTGS